MPKSIKGENKAAEIQLSPNPITEDQKAELLRTLKARFEKNKARHEGIEWSEVQTRLEANPDNLWSLQTMEETGGQPDVVGKDEATGQFIFMDCSMETPNRRSLCYDPQALEDRKEFKPAGSALGMAEQMGIEVLDEADYRLLQEKAGPLDTKTSTWLLTPNPIREKGGAIFGDWRYGQVFIYHNGVQSYYGSRGFRGRLLV
jgi:hypothetical protein